MIELSRKEKDKLRHKRWYDKHGKDWYKKNRIKVLNKCKRYTSRVEIKERISRIGKERTNLWKVKTFSILGNKCCRCGFNDSRAFQIDHINSDGRFERINTTERGYIFYRKVISSFEKGEKKYQLLCANCNWIKKSELNENKGVRSDCKIFKSLEEATLFPLQAIGSSVGGL